MSTDPTPPSGNDLARLAELSAAAKLWCMHVAGPDDVVAAPDFWTALAWAAELNAAIAARAVRENWCGDDNYPLCQATAAPWPWSPETHAANLSRALADRAARDQSRRDAAPTAAPKPPGPAQEGAKATVYWDDETRIAINTDADTRIGRLERALPFEISKHLSTICAHVHGLYDASDDPCVRELGVAIRACTADAGEAFLRALTPVPVPLRAGQDGGERVRHRQSGTEYEVLYRGARLQVAVERPFCDGHLGLHALEEGDRLVIYRCVADGQICAREESEFDDGRFERIAAAGGDENGWQPIKTAPKDGTHILGAGAFPGRVAEVWWIAGGWVRYESPSHAHWTGAPTHWRPLPAPPAEPAEG